MPKTDKRSLDTDAIEDLEDDLNDEDQDEGRQITPKLVNKFIRMWPRAIFHTSSTEAGRKGKRTLIAKTIKALERPGVYVLYRNDEPFYVGQAKGKLRSRLRAHANTAGASRSYFWNYFSAYIVEDRSHIDEVEAILIAAMPSAH